MDNDFFAYMQHLELMAFFSGYAMVFVAVNFVAGLLPLKYNAKNIITKALPASYAVVAALFAGLQANKLYSTVFVQHSKLVVQQPWLVLWGLAALIFWVPAVAKKAALGLIHSLVFFLFIVKDIIDQFRATAADGYILKNEMHIYTASLILNLFAFGVTLLFIFLLRRKRVSAA